VSGCAPRVREDSVHPRRQSGASGRPLNFTVRLHRAMHRLLRQLFASVCALISIACWWSTISALLRGALLGPVYFAVIFVASALFVATALAVWREWHGWRWFAGSSGGLLLLYATSVVLLGWEDVGGPAVAIPLSILTGLGGCVGVAIALKAESPYGAA
jgi:hypothetical protein